MLSINAPLAESFMPFANAVKHAAKTRNLFLKGSQMVCICSADPDEGDSL
jgi:hypothetical protein